MSSIDSRINEAHDNFINGRFQNAARLLQTPIQELSERKEINDFLDALYMSYFRLVALHRADNELELVSTINNISDMLKQYAAKRCLHNIEQPNVDLLSKLHFMTQARTIFNQINMVEQSESMRQSIKSVFHDLISTSDGDKKLEYLERLLSILNKEEYEYPDVKKSIIEILKNKSQQLHQYNLRERNTGGIPKDAEECIIELKLANLYQTEDSDSTQYHLKQAYKISPKLFPKYGFPEFESLDDIDQFSLPSL